MREFIVALNLLRGNKIVKTERRMDMVCSVSARSKYTGSVMLRTVFPKGLNGKTK